MSNTTENPVICATCGAVCVPDGCAAGYAVKRNGTRICYKCADVEQVAELKKREPFAAYVSSDGKRVATWSGGTLATITRVTTVRLTRQSFTHGKHILSIRCTDVHGAEWIGMGSPGIAIKLRPVMSAAEAKERKVDLAFRNRVAAFSDYQARLRECYRGKVSWPTQIAATQKVWEAIQRDKRLAGHERSRLHGFQEALQGVKYEETRFVHLWKGLVFWDWIQFANHCRAAGFDPNTEQSEGRFSSGRVYATERWEGGKPVEGFTVYSPFEKA